MAIGLGIGLASAAAAARARREQEERRSAGQVFGQSIAGAAGGAAGGLLMSPFHDIRQRRQQEKLQKLQIAGQQEMGKFNQGLALEMWDKTNFQAQRQQLEKAGLNPGLLYGMGGGGGATTQTPIGQVTGAAAPVGGGELGMGMQLGMAVAMQEAEIAKIKEEIPNISADTGLTEAKIETERYNQALKAIETDTKELDWSFYWMNQQDRNNATLANYKLAAAAANRAIEENKIDFGDDAKTGGYDLITRTRTEQLGKTIENELKREKIELTKSQQEKIAQEVLNLQADIINDKRKLDQEATRIAYDCGLGAEINRGAQTAKYITDSIGTLASFFVPKIKEIITLSGKQIIKEKGK